MRYVLPFLSALAASVLAADVPEPTKFLRRHSGRAVILGDYLYIDGGEVSELGDDDEVLASQTVNSTLSIDLSSSWSSNSVSIRTIAKSAPRLVSQSVWPDAGGDAFYIWGGHSKGGDENDKLVPKSIWRFVADGEGGGSWGTQIPDNRDVYADFHLSEGGAYTTAHNTGFYVGGMASGWTEEGRADTQPIPGVVSFNISQGTFANDSAADVSAFGTLFGGTLEFVPRFGPNGVVLVLGGATYDLNAGDQPQGSGRDFRNLTFFDPVTKQWYWQGTTGSAPTPRQEHCSVGVESPDGTYEIFVFGGWDNVNIETFDDVYILSLPGFVWSRAKTSQGGRRNTHSCVPIGGRQMLSVGGFGPGSWSDPDPFPQGLGIFDMTELSWGTDYDSDGEAYESPQVVKDWYKETGVESVEWSSAETKELFATENNNSASSKSPKGGGKSKVNAGAIAGGVGGVAIVAAIIAAVFFLRRRKRVQAHQPLPPTNPELLALAYANGASKAVEINSTPVAELQTEKQTGPPAELDGGGYAFDGHR